MDMVLQSQAATRLGSKKREAYERLPRSRDVGGELEGTEH